MTILLEKLGQNPQRSLHIFFGGIGLFILSLCFLALGYYYHHLWQIPGLLLLFIACLVTVWGYLGIFANRWLIIFTRNKTKKM